MKPASLLALTLPPARDTARVTLAVADERDGETIARLRHEVYACELGQHAVNGTGRLRDALDGHNIFLVARLAGEIAGFVSLTPPGRPATPLISISCAPRCPSPSTASFTKSGSSPCCVRTVGGRELATLLMYAAFRWVEAHGGTRIVAIGRREVVVLYARVGLRPLGLSAPSGAVTYELMLATLDELRALGWDVLPGIANFLLCHLPASGPDAETIVQHARPHGLFVRNAATMSPRLGLRTLRLAVKDAATKHRMLEILGPLAAGCACHRPCGSRGTAPHAH